MKKIILLTSALLMSIGLVLGQSVEITPNKTTAEGVQPSLELKRLKNNSSDGALIDAYRSRDSGGSDAPLTKGTSLLTIQANGWNGLSYKLGSKMSIEASDHWGAPGTGTDFRLSLTRPNSTLPTEWFTVKGTGDVGLGSLEPGAKLDIPNGSTNDYYPSIRLLHTSSGFNRIAFETLGKTGNFIIASKIESSPADSRLHFYSKDAPIGNILSLTGDGTIIHEGYTRLGSAASSAPKIKMKKITGTTDANSSSFFTSHGLTASKILDVSILIETEASPPLYYPPNSGSTEYQYRINQSSIYVFEIDSYLRGRPFKMLITYEE